MNLQIKPLYLFIFLALFTLISACVSVPSETAPNPLPATPTSQPTETQVEPTPTVPTPTATPTAPAPTETALSMPPTPTPLPAVVPTPPPLSYLPADLPVISPGNAAQLYQVAWLAEDRLTGVAWSPDGKWMGTISLHGVTVYEAAAMPPACYGEGCDISPAAGHFVPVENPDPGGVFLSPDGKTLAVLRINDSAVDLYDVANGQLNRTLEWLDHAAPVLYGVAFSPDWSTLAWYTRGTLLLMDVATGRQGPVMSTEDFIQAIAFSPDGSLITASAGGTFNGEFQPLVQLWQVSDGKPFVTLAATQVTLNSVANLLRFSQDGRYLMAGHYDGSIAVWNIPSGEPSMFIGGSNLPVTDLALSDDGNSLLAAYANQSATFWDLTKSREPVTWSGTLATVSHDARMVALLSPDGWLKMIDPASNQEIATLANNPYLDTLSFSPDSRYLAALSIQQSSLSLWQVPEAVELAPLSIIPDNAADLAFSPDGGIIIAAWYGCQARIWDALSGKILHMLEPSDSGCGAEPALALSPNPDDPTLALASGSGKTSGVTLWNYINRQEITTLSLEQGVVNSLAFSPADILLAAGTGQSDASGNVTGGQAVVWDLSDDTVALTLPHDAWVTGLAFSPDGQTLATGTAALDAGGAVSGSQVNLWDVKTGQLLRSMESPGDHVVSLAYSPDGTILAAGDWSGSLILWEAGSGKQLATLGSHNSPVVDLAFSPDGQLLAAAILTGGASTVEIWDMASKEKLAQLEGENLAFSPDGTALASIVFGSARLWGVAP